MDALSGLLSGPRASGAFTIRSELVAPWCLRIEDHSPLTLVVVTRGTATITLDGDGPVPLTVGDTALVQGHRGYDVADTAGRAPQARIGVGQVCTKPDGSPLSDFRDLGVMTWGNLPEGVEPETVLLTGTYERGARVGEQLLTGLPDLAVVARDATTGPLLDLLALEVGADGPGQGVVLDRLVDLLTVSLVRAWFAGPSGRAPGWYAAYDDPVAGAALRRIHHEPHRAWTVESLAAEAGVSRATLARRFLAVVGETPVAYLARWRLDLAADLLRDTDLTLAAVAHRVGYATPFSFSAAFSRKRGVSPTTYRASGGRAGRPPGARRRTGPPVVEQDAPRAPVGAPGLRWLSRTPPGRPSAHRASGG